MNYFLNTDNFFPYIMLTFKVKIYIFSEMIWDILHSSKNESFFGLYNVWEPEGQLSWYLMT